MNKSLNEVEDEAIKIVLKSLESVDDWCFTSKVMAGHNTVVKYSNTKLALFFTIFVPSRYNKMFNSVANSYNLSYLSGDESYAFKIDRELLEKFYGNLSCTNMDEKRKVSVLNNFISWSK